MSERRTISKRDVANLTGGVETADGRVLYGLDAETYLKMRAKEDPLRERRLAEWIENFLGEKLENPNDLHQSLKSGIILIKIVNKLRPNFIKNYNQEVAGKKLNPIAETANIQLFLQSCVQLGIPRSALFDVYDLYARKNMAQVFTTLETLAQLKIYDPSTQQQIAPPPLEQPPASRRTAPKKWQDVETAPQMVHVAGLSDDELVDELIKVKKELHEANRKIELLEYELELAQRKRNAVNVGTEEDENFGKRR